MTDVTEATEQAADEVKDKAGGDGGGSSLGSKLVVPAAAAAGTLLSGFVAKKVPDLLRDHVLPRLEQTGEQGGEELGKGAIAGAKKAAAEHGGLAGKAAGKLLGGGGGGGGGDDQSAPPRGWGRGRRLPVQVSIDVAVPVDVAYNQWTQFEDFPEFMHRVEQIEQEDDETLVWHENIWHIRRTWKSEIVEQVPNERIVWRSESRGGHSGVVTFHRLSDRLTRIELNVDFQPKGVFEKLSSGLRFHKRALETDLERFKAFVEMRNEETGKWRGKIRDEDRNPARAERDDEEQEQGGSGSSNGNRSDDAEKSRKEREERRKKRQKAMSS